MDVAQFEVMIMSLSRSPIILAMTILFSACGSTPAPKPRDSSSAPTPAASSAVPAPNPFASTVASPVPTPSSNSASTSPGSVPTAQANIISYAEVKPIIDRSCVAACHGPGGSRTTYFNTYAGINAFKASIIQLSTSANPSMPPQGGRTPLTAAEKALLKSWQSGGYLEKAGATPGRASPSPSPSLRPVPASGQTANFSTMSGMDSIASNVVHFSIAPGTGRGAWNSQDTIVHVRRGQSLVIQNDDTQMHQLHTNGSPCPHGQPIAPGAQQLCQINGTQTGDMHDHLNGGRFFVVVDN